MKIFAKVYTEYYLETIFAVKVVITIIVGAFLAISGVNEVVGVWNSFLILVVLMTSMTFVMKSRETLVWNEFTLLLVYVLTAACFAVVAYLLSLALNLPLTVGYPMASAVSGLCMLKYSAI